MSDTGRKFPHIIGQTIFSSDIQKHSKPACVDSIYLLSSFDLRVHAEEPYNKTEVTVAWKSFLFMSVSLDFYTGGNLSTETQCFTQPCAFIAWDFTN